MTPHIFNEKGECINCNKEMRMSQQHVPGSTHDSENQYTMAARLGREERPIGEWESANELEVNQGLIDMPLNGEQFDILNMDTLKDPEEKKLFKDVVHEEGDSVFIFSDPTKIGSLEEEEGTGANKLDRGKPNMALLPGHIMADVAAVLTDGAARPEYGADNWRQGLKMRRLLSAAMRHIMAFSDGQDYDPKSPFKPRCHLANAICMCIFALEMWKTRPDMDDRFYIEDALVTASFADEPIEEEYHSDLGEGPLADAARAIQADVVRGVMEEVMAQKEAHEGAEAQYEKVSASLVSSEVDDMTREELYALITDLYTQLDVLLEVD